MKISVPDWCFYGKIGEGARYYETLKEIGVDAVEMVAPERHALARAAGLQILNAAGPGMQVGLNWGMEFVPEGDALSELREAVSLFRHLDILAQIEKSFGLRM